MAIMTLHYHGTPITPAEVFLTLGGRCFDASSWEAVYIDAMPGADFWGGNDEPAQTPLAWHRIATAPPIPAREAASDAA